jgi:hypothetical protein
MRRTALNGSQQSAISLDRPLLEALGAELDRVLGQPRRAALCRVGLLPGGADGAARDDSRRPAGRERRFLAVTTRTSP